MENRHYKLKFIIIQFITYLSYGLVMANLIPFLEKLGYDIVQRGYILSSYAMANIVLQIVFGYIGDKFRTLKPIIIGILSIYAISTILFFSSVISSYVFVLIIASVMAGGLNTLCGFQDTWIMLINEELEKSLSTIKAFGSIGWAIGSLVSSYLIGYMGYNGIGLVAIISVALVLWTLKSLPDIHSGIEGEEVSLKILASLLKIKNYVYLLVALFIMFGLIIANTSIVVDKMLALNATTFDISLKWAMGSLLEIPMYLYCNQLIKKYGSIKLLGFSSMVLVIQFLLFSIAASPLQIILVTLLQIFTTPIILVTSKRVIARLVPPVLASSGQMIALSVFLGGGSLIIPQVNSYLGKNIGISPALLVYAVVGVLSVIIIKLLQSQIREDVE